MGLIKISSLSLSQSDGMLTTLRKWLELSPLVHSRYLVREKGDLTTLLGYRQHGMIHIV